MKIAKMQNTQQYTSFGLNPMRYRGNGIDKKVLFAESTMNKIRKSEYGLFDFEMKSAEIYNLLLDKKFLKKSPALHDKLLSFFRDYNERSFLESLNLYR